MSTHCTANQLEFLPFKNSDNRSPRTRHVTGKFDSDRVSSNGGAILLREIEQRFGIIKKLSECFKHHRNTLCTTHSVYSMVAQRVLGIFCGCKDVGDHDQLRNDPIVSMFCGASAQLASESIIDRVEPGVQHINRYRK